MKLDERKEHALMFIGEFTRRDPILQLSIEAGDEATLYHKGNLIMATIKEINPNQMVGLITRSYYDPNRHLDYVFGKEIYFTEENVFGISRKKRRA